MTCPAFVCPLRPFSALLTSKHNPNRARASPNNQKSTVVYILLYSVCTSVCATEVSSQNLFQVYQVDRKFGSFNRSRCLVRPKLPRDFVNRFLILSAGLFVPGIAVNIQDRYRRNVWNGSTRNSNIGSVNLLYPRFCRKSTPTWTRIHQRRKARDPLKKIVGATVKGIGQSSKQSSSIGSSRSRAKTERLPVT